jgi:hypothetical protein
MHQYPIPPNTPNTNIIIINSSTIIIVVVLVLVVVFEIDAASRK